MEPQPKNRAVKRKIAEWLPFSLFLFSAVCYLLSDHQQYADTFEKLDYCIKACFAFCVFAYLVADAYDWGVSAKGSIAGLVMFNIINFIDRFYFDSSLGAIYYDCFFTVGTVVLGLIVIYEFLCQYLK